MWIACVITVATFCRDMCPGVVEMTAGLIWHQTITLWWEWLAIGIKTAAVMANNMRVHANAGSCCHVSMSPFMGLWSNRHLNQIDFLKQWQQSVILSAANGQNALTKVDTMPKDWCRKSSIYTYVSIPRRCEIRGLISGKPCRINYHPGQLVPKAIDQRLASPRTSPEATRPRGITWCVHEWPAWFFATCDRLNVYLFFKCPAHSVLMRERPQNSPICAQSTVTETSPARWTKSQRIMAADVKLQVRRIQAHEKAPCAQRINK